MIEQLTVYQELRVKQSENSEGGESFSPLLGVLSQEAEASLRWFFSSLSSCWLGLKKVQTGKHSRIERTEK